MPLNLFIDTISPRPSDLEQLLGKAESGSLMLLNVRQRVEFSVTPAGQGCAGGGVWLPHTLPGCKTPRWAAEFRRTLWW